MGSHYGWREGGIWTSYLEGIEVWKMEGVGIYGLYNGNPLLLVWIVDVKCRHPIWRGLKRGRWGGLGGTNCGDGVMKCIQTFTIVLQDVLSARRHSLLCRNTSCSHSDIHHCAARRLVCTQAFTIVPQHVLFARRHSPL